MSPSGRCVRLCVCVSLVLMLFSGPVFISEKDFVETIVTVKGENNRFREKPAIIIKIIHQVHQIFDQDFLIFFQHIA